MNKRKPRLQVEFNQELPSNEQADAPPPHLNEHLDDKRRYDDKRLSRKHTKQHLHLLEGGGFDPDWASEIADSDAV